MTNFEFTKRHRKPYSKTFACGIILSILSIIFVMLLPQITQLFIDSVFSFTGTQEPTVGVWWQDFISVFSSLTTTQIVLYLSISFILCAVLKNLCTLLATQNFFKIGMNACGDVRQVGFQKLAHLTPTPSKSQVFFNFTSDIDDLYNYYCSVLPKQIALPVLITIASILCLLIDFKITLCFIPLLPAIIIISFIFNKKSVQNFRTSRQKLSEMVQAGEEIVGNIKEIKVFGNEDWALEKYTRYNSNHLSTVKDASLYINKRNILLNLIRVAGIIIAITLSAVACFNGEMSIGFFVLISSYAFTIFNTAVDFVSNNYDLGIANAGIERLNNLISTHSESEDKPDFKGNPTITFENVDIALAGKTMFSDTNLTFEFGKHYALNISQGAGKTAFARILLDFAKPSKGQITLNSKPWENFNQASKRKMFSYISQEAFIFEGSIEENIVMFAEENPTRLKKALKTANLTPLISSLEHKADTFLYENGANITAQDRQKINIARAVFKNAPILLIDNAFNKFKKEEAEALILALKKAFKDKTIILLSNKKNEIALFENVFTLKNGQLQETNKKQKTGGAK